MFADESKLSEWFAGWEQRCPAPQFLHLVGVFAEALRFQDRKRDAVTLLEFAAGLRPGDYVPERLGERLAPLTARAGDAVRGLVHTLSGMFRAVGRQQDALTLGLTHLGLSRATFDNPARLREKLDELRRDVTPGLIAEVGEALYAAERHRDALRVLEGFLGFAGEDYDHPEEVARRLRAWAVERRNDQSSIFLGALGAVLVNAGRGADAALLLESFMGVRPGDYASEPALGARVREWSRNQEANNVVAYLLTLADVLDHVGRPSDGSRLLHAFLCLADRDPAHSLPMDVRVGYWRERLTGATLQFVLREVGRELAHQGRPDEAAVLIQADVGLDWDGDPEEMAARLGAWTARVGSTNAAGGVASLTDWLLEARQTDRAARVMEWFVRDFGWLDDPLSGPVPVNAIRVVERWLLLFGERDRARALDTCGRAVTYLRRSLHREGLVLEDREQFVAQIGELRRRVIETAHTWAQKDTHPGTADAIRLRAALWDAELGQRLVLERFLLGRMELSATRDPDRPEPNWPLAENQPRPAFDGPRTELREAGRLVIAFGASESDNVSDPVGELTAAQNVPEWYPRAAGLVAAGVTAEELARRLGPTGLLLRATFSTAGRLRWTALRAEGPTLAVVGHEDRGTPSDQARLRWAAALHDLAIDWVYLYAGRGPGARALLGEALTRLLGAPAAAALERLAADGTGLQTAPEVWGQFCTSVSTSVPPGVGIARGQARAAAERLGRALAERLTPFFRPPHDLREFDDWASRLGDQVHELFAQLRGIPADPSAPHGRLLDDATRQFLERVGRVWVLDALAPHLTEETDVLVQVDDALHAVPVGLLPAGGRPLCEQVRSLRSSISVLLDLVQGEIEDTVRRLDPNPNRLLTCTWFAPGDPAWSGGAILQHGQANLARAHGLLWGAAGVRPEARCGVLFRGIGEGAFRAVTVCGHGDAWRGGVQLADRLWRGSGQDLSRIELLLMVSCSVGRVRQSGQQDVEGFSVELALHRGRSAISCRWPVDAFLAPAFTNEVLAHYLKLVTARDATATGQRATALNRARRDFLGLVTETGRPGVLNTVAAFELYGLA